METNYVCIVHFITQPTEIMTKRQVITKNLYRIFKLRKQKVKTPFDATWEKNLGFPKKVRVYLEKVVSKKNWKFGYQLYRCFVFSTTETPFQGYPVLSIDGKKYCQAPAISRYLARQFGKFNHVLTHIHAVNSRWYIYEKKLKQET